MTQPRLKHFGWGREGERLTPAEEAFVLGRIEQLFGPLSRGQGQTAAARGHQARTAPARSTANAAVLLDRAL